MKDNNRQKSSICHALSITVDRKGMTHVTSQSQVNGDQAIKYGMEHAN